MYTNKTIRCQSDIGKERSVTKKTYKALFKYLLNICVKIKYFYLHYFSVIHLLFVTTTSLSLNDNHSFETVSESPTHSDGLNQG